MNFWNGSTGILTSPDELSPLQFRVNAVEDVQVVGRSVRSGSRVDAARFAVEHERSLDVDNPRISARWPACRGR